MTAAGTDVAPPPARPRKTVAIVQSNYIPWKGYFDLIRSADEFILFDSMQYTRRDWRNRNQIKTEHGLAWLTIPVNVKGRFHQAIRDTTVSDRGWAERHWSTLRHAYARAPFFKAYADRFETAYSAAATLRSLSEINALLIREVCSCLGITTVLSWDTDYPLVEGKTERLVALCLAAGATHYLSGPSARDYIVPELFERADLGLEWLDYRGYPEYPQLYPPFEHAVSILDLIFHTGPDAARYLRRGAVP
jgi:hypothetical protein